MSSGLELLRQRLWRWFSTTWGILKYFKTWRECRSNRKQTHKLNTNHYTGDNLKFPAKFQQTDSTLSWHFVSQSNMIWTLSCMFIESSERKEEEN